MRGRVLPYARFRIVNAHNDQRLDLASVNALVCRLPDVPVLPRDEGRRAVEEILPVLKVEDRKPPCGLLCIAGRRVNDKRALIAQKARPEPFVLAELT